MGSGAKKKGARKNKSEGGGEPPLLFIAIFTSHRSPLSERLEQAKRSGTRLKTESETLASHSRASRA